MTHSHTTFEYQTISVTSDKKRESRKPHSMILNESAIHDVGYLINPRPQPEALDFRPICLADAIQKSFIHLLISSPPIIYL